MLGVADLVVLGEHLAGDLGIARFVCAYEAELISAEARGEAVEQEEEPDAEEDDVLPGRREGVGFGDALEDAAEKRGLRG